MKIKKLKKIGLSIKSVFSRFIDSPEKAYLVIALIGTIGFALITPPFQGPDEEAHYNRVQYITHGYFVPTNVGGEVSLPASIQDVLNKVFFENDIRGKTAANYELWRTKQALGIKLNPDKRFSPIMLNYNFLTYLPAIPGVFLANSLNLSPLVSMYLARILLALAAVLITYLAVKIIPVKKYLFVALALTPMMLFQQAMIGTDGVSYAIFMLFLAYLFKLYAQTNEISRRQWIYFIVLCGLLMWSKPLLYLFLPLAIILVKKKKFWGWITIAATVCIVLLGVNQVMVNNQVSNVVHVNKNEHAGPPSDVDSTKQLSNLLKKPHKFPRILWSSYMTNYGDDEVRGLIGTFGYADVYFPLWMNYVYISIIVMAILVDNKSQKYKKIPKYWRFLIIILSLVHFMAVNLAIYLGYTPVDFPIVYGVQGRYFLPEFIILIVGLSAYGWSITDKLTINKFKKYIVIVSLIVVLLALFITFQRYFLFTP